MEFDPVESQSGSARERETAQARSDRERRNSLRYSRDGPRPHRHLRGYLFGDIRAVARRVPHKKAFRPREMSSPLVENRAPMKIAWVHSSNKRRLKGQCHCCADGLQLCKHTRRNPWPIQVCVLVPDLIGLTTNRRNFVSPISEDTAGKRGRKHNKSLSQQARNKQACIGARDFGGSFEYLAALFQGTAVFRPPRKLRRFGKRRSLNQRLISTHSFRVRESATAWTTRM